MKYVSLRALHIVGGLGLAVALFCGGTGTAHAEAVNLISNPSLDTAGSGGVPAGWVKEYWGSQVPTFKYPDIGRSGGASASVTLKKNSSGDARWSHSPSAVTAGKTYTFTAWYKSNAATEIDAAYTGTNGKVTYAYVTAVPSSGNTWKQVSASITVPAGVTKAVVYHLLQKKGTLTIDDYSFTEDGAAPPPPPPPPPPTDLCPNVDGVQTTTPCASDMCILPAVWDVGSQACVTPPPPPPPQDSEWAGMVTISFDDAWRSQYTHALPILEAAGFRGTFYILTEGVQGGWDDYMTPAMVADLAARGHNVEGHTISHRDLAGLSNSAIDKEIKNSKSYIESLAGTVVSSLAYPYGSYSTKVINRTTLAGYTTGRSADPTTALGFNVKTTPHYELNSFSPTTGVSVAEMKAAVDKAQAEKLWFIFSFHEVEDGNADEYATTIARFQEVVDYITSSGIKVVTIKEGTSLLAP